MNSSTLGYVVLLLALIILIYAVVRLVKDIRNLNEKYKQLMQQENESDAFNDHETYRPA